MWLGTSRWDSWWSYRQRQGTPLLLCEDIMTSDYKAGGKQHCPSLTPRVWERNPCCLSHLVYAPCYSNTAVLGMFWFFLQSNISAYLCLAWMDRVARHCHSCPLWCPRRPRADATTSTAQPELIETQVCSALPHNLCWEWRADQSGLRLWCRTWNVPSVDCIEPVDRPGGTAEMGWLC